jgi:glycosyltransferase involved in cell wall biosynthesis
MSERMKLSICTMVYHDEARILDYLKSIQGRADEIIFADLGSTDKTMEHIRNAGAKAYPFKWNESRSEVKNFCMEQASGTWILFLQPDERMQEEHWKQLALLLQNPNAEEYLIYVDQGIERGIVSPADSLRLVRNRKEYRYHCRSYEYIPDEMIGNRKDTDLRIHKARGGRESTCAEKGHVNIFEAEQSELLFIDLKENPQSAYLQYRYGIELLNQNEMEAGARSLEIARKTANADYFYTPHLYKCLAWSYLNLDDSLAERVLEEGIRRFPNYLDLVALRGELHKQRGAYQDAIYDFESSLKILHSKNGKAAGSEITEPIILENLGWLHDKLLCRRKAAVCYFQVLNQMPVNEQHVLRKLGEVLIKSGDREGFELLFREFAEKKDPESMLVLMDVLYRYHDYSGVLMYLNDLENDLDREAADFIRYGCYKRLGRSDEANQCFTSLCAEPRLCRQIHLQELEDLLYEGSWASALNFLTKTAAEVAGEPFLRTYERICKWCISEDGMIGEAAPELFETLTPEEQEIAEELLNYFLWSNRMEEGKKLLAFVFLGKTERQRMELIQELAERELICGTGERAAALAAFSNVMLPESLEVHHWSRKMMSKLKEWLNPIPLKDSRCCSSAALGLRRELFETPEYHCDMANRFEANNQKKESFFAYLQAIMRDPCHEEALEHISELFRKDPEARKEDLYSDQWILSGSVFNEKTEFRDFISGVSAFASGDFSNSIEMFCNCKESYLMASVYLASAYWMNGEEQEAERLKQKIATLDFQNKVYDLCKKSILHRLLGYYEENLDNDLIAKEIQRIKGL